MLACFDGMGGAGATGMGEDCGREGIQRIGGEIKPTVGDDSNDIPYSDSSSPSRITFRHPRRIESFFPPGSSPRP